MTDLRKLHEAATPGPWHAQDRGVGWEVHVEGELNPDRYCDHNSLSDLEYHAKDTMLGRDAALIAATRNALPFYFALEDAVRALQAALDQAERFARIGSPPESQAGARLAVNKAEKKQREALAALDAHVKGTP